MNLEDYPPSHLSHLARRVQDSAASGIRRDWTGNDKSARNHHGVVDLHESPLRLRLSWRRSPCDPAQLIGVFDLDLPGLLAGHYVRVEPGTRNGIRLRFYHGSDDVIYIQANRDGPGMPIGKVLRG